jgi:hypothetical protein
VEKGRLGPTRTRTWIGIDPQSTRECSRLFIAALPELHGKPARLD